MNYSFGFLSRCFPAVIFLIVLGIAGCGSVYKSRIYLDSFSRAKDGLVISNFSNDEVDEFVRAFVIQKGYEIRFANSSEEWIQQELGNEESSLIWLAEKKDEPTMLFISSGNGLVISFVQVTGYVPSSRLKEYDNVLYMVLREKFGRENVHLDD